MQHEFVAHLALKCQPSEPVCGLIEPFDRPLETDGMITFGQKLSLQGEFHTPMTGEYVLTVNRVRMRPTKAQEPLLDRVAGARRWVWNWALGRRKADYAEYGKTILASQLSSER